MRIVLVYQHFSIGSAGSSKPYDLAKYLAGAGHEVTVISGRSSIAASAEVPAGLVARLRVDGFDILCLGVRYDQSMSKARRFWAFVAFTLLSMAVVCFLPKYDVLVASSTPLTVGLVGLVSRYVRRLPWVFELRDFWPESTYANQYLRSRTLFRVATFFEEWFYRQASAICAISQRMIDRLIERGFPPGKLHFIPTGVNISAHEVGRDEEFRKAHNLTGQWVAVYAGAHGRVNGLDYLIEAAECLKDDADIRIVLVGEGTEKARLVAEAQSRGLTPQPLLFLPAVPRGRVPGILKACDAALMINVDRPGMKDLMTNKFFDYLASARPIVVNLEAELTNWMRRSDCGLLADPKRPEDLARVLRELKANAAEAEQMGLRGRRLAEEQFDRAKLHKKWEDVLARAAAGKRAAVRAS